MTLEGKYSNFKSSWKKVSELIRGFEGLNEKQAFNAAGGFESISIHLKELSSYLSKLRPFFARREKLVVYRHVRKTFEQKRLLLKNFEKNFASLSEKKRKDNLSKIWLKHREYEYNAAAALDILEVE